MRSHPLRAARKSLTISFDIEFIMFILPNCHPTERVNLFGVYTYVTMLTKSKYMLNTHLQSLDINI